MKHDAARPREGAGGCYAGLWMGGAASPGASWTRSEIREAVSSYFDMLSLELAGARYSKTDFRNALLLRLPVRSKGSVEYKHQNISAVLALLGAPHIAGYKPATNFQSALVEEVARELNDRQLDGTAALQGKPPEIPVAANASPLRIVPRPSPLAVAPEQRQMIDHARHLVYRNIDWASRDAGNRSLGALGEELVLRWERFRLRAAGMERLARKIVHASREEGDGLGYDIRSFDLSGNPRLIEVKTTAAGASMPFFVSQREVEASQRHAQHFIIGRVYSVRSNASIFEIPGSIATSCKLTPTMYRAVAC